MKPKQLSWIQTKAFWWLSSAGCILYSLQILATLLYMSGWPCAMFTHCLVPALPSLFTCSLSVGWSPVWAPGLGRLHLGPLLTSHLHPDRAGPTGHRQPIRIHNLGERIVSHIIVSMTIKFPSNRKLNVLSLDIHM